MANNILKWTERSRQENRKLFAYLLNEWGENIALKVRDQIIVSSDRIRDFPEQFPIFILQKRIRRCVVSRQTSIFFKSEEGIVEILAIFDNRQNPKKLRKLT